MLNQFVNAAVPPVMSIISSVIPQIISAIMNPQKYERAKLRLFIFLAPPKEKIQIRMNPTIGILNKSEYPK